MPTSTATMVCINVCSQLRIPSKKGIHLPKSSLDGLTTSSKHIRTNPEGHHSNISLSMATKSTVLPTHQSKSVLVQCCMWATKNSLPPPEHPLRKQDCSGHAKPHWEGVKHITYQRITQPCGQPYAGAPCQGGKVVVYPLPQANCLRKEMPQGSKWHQT